MNEVSVMPLAMKRRAFFCPACGEKLIPYPKTRILQRGDPEYREHSRVMRGKHIVGKIELTEYDFKCLSCDTFITYDEQCVNEEIQKRLEKHILSPEEREVNAENAKAALAQKEKRRKKITRIISLVVITLFLLYWLQTGELSFRIFF